MAKTLTAAIAALKTQYGDAHAAVWPSTWQTRLYQGDPRDGGVELDTTNYPGYAAGTVGNTSANFPDPDGTSGVMTSAVLTFATPTGDWDDVPSHVGLCDPTGGVLLEVFAVDFGVYADGTPGAGEAVTGQIQVTYPWQVA